MRIAVLISNGTEEIEVVTPIDVLRRSGALVDVVSVVEKKIIGSHGIVITADKIIEEICEEDYDGIVIPGGMPGAKIISENKTAILVTHDISEAIAMSNRIIVLTERPGKVKTIIDLNFDPKLAPFERRKQPQFSKYFDMVWRELV